jgi:hypothetical protein
MLGKGGERLMTTDHDVLQYIKDNYPDVFQRLRAKSGGLKEPTIKTLIDTLDKGSMAK